MNLEEKPIIWRDVKFMLNNTLHGRVSNMELSISREMIELEKGLSGIANISVPTGKFEAITATVDFNSLSSADLRHFAGNDGFVSLKLMAEMSVLDSANGTKTTGMLTTRVNGWVKNIPSIPKGKTENVSVEISVAKVEIYDAQAVLLLIDIPLGIVEPKQTSGSKGLTLTF